MSISSNCGRIQRRCSASPNNKLNSRRDEDLGYTAHAWLTAVFGQGAIKPFRLLQDSRNRQPPRLLGFSSQSGEQLIEHAQAFASPLALQVCPLEANFAAKPMPAQWRAGRRLGFELLASPISRLKQNEDDIYRRHVREREASGQQPDSRDAVYRLWLEHQLGTAAILEDYSLEGFRIVRLLRKAEGAGRRDFLAPQAKLGGILTVQDGTAFQTLLARGIGRHRAFGYGMLLLRPAP
ncbi:type I-E CRISPR-associated protein Cas6/Cse3/CasE [Methylogaea oryzae]|uniref:type I-E CRISPR-associated protein Cas6/Cse3/CasE n=1 Tax=Methylogaea oryzae TaxID=1295382 RepID=UPI00278C7A83|nr:type I-E CRISPR-associated protein Cas6/Cse3/CasE [Methylogaea oryzae]